MRNSLTVVLDNVRSAHNVGAVFRCCDAFGVDQLWLCGITASPPHPGIEKTALGATEYVDWYYEQSTEKLLLGLPRARRIAVETGEESIPLQSFSRDRKEDLVLVFGHEVEGISPQVMASCTERLSIPQLGHKNSLNVSVAVGIVLWKVAEQSLLF